MRRFLGLCLLCGLLGAALAGCATPPEPPRRTTLILLPDDDGRVGSATLGNAQGLQTLHEAFSGTSAVGTAGAPARAQVLGKDAVDARYASLLAAQPLPPRSFTLYFLHGKTDMTEASKARLPELLRAAQERRPHDEVPEPGDDEQEGPGDGELHASMLAHAPPTARHRPSSTDAGRRRPTPGAPVA